MATKTNIWGRIDLAIVLAAGIGSVGFGAQIALMSLSRLGATEVSETLGERKLVPTAELDRAAALEKASLSWRETAQSWTNLALELAVKANSSNGPEQAAVLADAEQALRHAVSLAPANPYAWLRLAVITRLRDSPPADVIRYWRLSEITGPNEPLLFVERIQIAIANWPELQQSDRILVFREIRSIWDSDRIWEIGNDADDFTVNVIRAALASDISAFRKYEEFEKRRKEWKAYEKNKNAPS